MKKKLLTGIVALLLFSACKKIPLNTTLDGVWETTTIDGINVGTNQGVKFAFSKTGTDNGAVTVTFFSNGTVADAYTGTYNITDKDNTLTIDATEAVPASGSTAAYTSTIHASGTIALQDNTHFSYNETIVEKPSGSTQMNVFVFHKQ